MSKNVRHYTEVPEPICAILPTAMPVPQQLPQIAILPTRYPNLQKVIFEH